MSEKYVEVGYVEAGYVEGSGFSLPNVGDSPLKFFVSSGTKSEEVLKSDIQALLGDNDMSLIYVPENSKIMLGNKTGFVEFLGGVNIQDIINNQEFIDKVTELSNVSLIASIVGSDGSVVSDATVTQVDETTFNVTIPTELVGTDYNIVFSES